jgi:hypothetical protein
MLSSMFPFGNTSKIARGEESIGQRPFDPESGSSAIPVTSDWMEGALAWNFCKGPLLCEHRGCRPTVERGGEHQTPAGIAPEVT